MTATPVVAPDKLTAARENAGLTRRRAAAKLGISYHALAAYEQGRTDPSAAVLVRMAWLYHVRVEKLIRPREQIERELTAAEQAGPEMHAALTAARTAR